MTTIARLTAIPVCDQLDGHSPYGSSRGLLHRRAATLVRLETSDGVVGWGEAWGDSPASKVLVDQLADQLIGSELAPSPNWLTDLLQRSYHYSSSGPHTAVASAVDTAMWDAFARQLELPIHRLLGGPTRRRLQAYASTGYVTERNDLAEYRAALEKSAADGFSAVKIKLGMGPRSDHARAEIARDVFGPDASLFVDYNGNYTADQAVRSIRSLVDIGIDWVEEPVTPDDRQGWKLLRGTGVPLAAGEAVYTRFGFRDLIADRLVDVVQPDVSKCGGISEARVIAHLAQTWNVRFSPHVWGGAIAQAASVQLLACVPDYPHTDHAAEPMWLELDRGPNALRDELAGSPLHQERAEVVVPDGPGLGIEVDEQALSRLRSDQ